MADNLRGHNERFKELFNQHKNHVYDYAIKMVYDRDTAGDITQEVFVRLFEKLKINSNLLNVQNWLFIIARNLCLNKLRDSKREVNIEQAGNMEAFAYGNINPKHILVQKAMMNLETSHREALILKEYQGFSYEEMSSLLGITVSAVRSLLYKARLNLKENFEKINTGR